MSFTDRLGMTVQQVIAAWVLVLFVGGAAGVVAMLLCHYMLTFGGDDSADKHGISQVTATRVGGVAIVSYMLLHLGFQYYLGAYNPSVAENAILLTAGAYFFLGMYEDLQGTLSARARFGTMLCIALVALLSSPHLILAPVGIMGLDTALGFPVTAFLVTLICVAFIPNAFNTADGANGLVSGIALMVMSGLTLAAPPSLIPFLSAGAVGCLIFLIFNLISGRFFLGDGGAYFLGALCGLSVVIVSNGTDANVWWLLALIFYPVADLMYSMARRWGDGGSPLVPDNKHFHNLVFVWLDMGRSSSQTANTLCGVGIALVFSGLPLSLCMSGALATDATSWLWVVVLQWTAYLLGMRYLNQRLCLLPEDQESSVNALASEGP
jgi:UDP-GlcNAc:undecaprenyl-phosphate GlcNAc-1-phosphate transferase